VDPVRGVDAGKLGAPAAEIGGQVGDVQAVTPAVAGLEQRHLRAGMRTLAAGEDRMDIGQPATVRALAQQAG
jgi:hypothetical protein